MTLGGEVHDRVRVVRGEDLPHRVGVGDVCADQRMACVAPSLLERVLGRGVRHLVDVDDRVVGIADQSPDHGRPDETTAAG